MKDIKSLLSSIKSELNTKLVGKIDAAQNSENQGNPTSSSQPSKQSGESSLKQVEDKIDELKEKEKKFQSIDNEIANLINSQDANICLNIGGELFYTKLSTILAVKDTLLYKLIVYKIQKKLQLEDTIFIDRNPTHFNVFLNYLRTKKFDYCYFNPIELEDIKYESDFYGIKPMLDQIEQGLKVVTIVSFESSPRYSNVGTYKLADLTDRSLSKGICVQSPYHIIFELNHQAEVSEIEVGGYNGNTNSWGPSNGANANILTSIDKKNWKEVGKLPSDFGNTIKRIVLTRSTASYIKFQNTSYLGIGFLAISK